MDGPLQYSAEYRRDRTLRADRQKQKGARSERIIQYGNDERERRYLQVSGSARVKFKKARLTDGERCGSHSSS